MNFNRLADAKWDEASNIAIKVFTKPCPKCRTATERAGGCMHMVRSGKVVLIVNLCSIFVFFISHRTVRVATLSGVGSVKSNGIVIAWEHIGLAKTKNLKNFQ